MRSLFFITRKTLKNRLLQIFKSPGKLILYLLVLAAVVGLIIITVVGAADAGNLYEVTSLEWLRGIMFAFLLISFIPGFLLGLKQGGNLFQMHDVNFLFVSPLRPQSILLYGILRTIAMTLLGGLFILFQTGGIGRTFDIGFSGLLVVFAGYVLAVIFTQLMTLAIYSFSNGNDRRKSVVRALGLLLFLPVLAMAMRAFLRNGGDLMPALQELVYSPVMAWTPILGWASEGTIAILGGDVLRGVLFYAATMGAGVLLLLYAYIGGEDYYEDAMAVTETTFEKIRAAEQGNIGAAMSTDKKVKVAKTGLGGSGEKSLFYKHLRESSRQNRTFLWGGFSFVMVLGAAVFALLSSDSSIFVILPIYMFISMFSIGTGRGMKELYSHYIYLIPASPFRKIIWSNVEMLFKIAVESTLVFAISGIILGETLLFIVLAIAIYMLFCLVLLGVQYMLLRWTGSHLSPMILLTVYMLALLLLLTPGAVASIFVGMWVGGTAGMYVGLAIFALWELIVSVVCIVLSKGVLHNCDMMVLDAKLK